MSLETLVAALEREAEERARAVLAEATERARRIRQRTQEEVEERRTARLREHRRRLEAEAGRREAKVRRQVEEVVLTARAELLEGIFAEARGRLAAALETDAYREVLPAHLEEALRFVDSGRREAEVVVPPALEAAVERILSSRDGEGSPSTAPPRIVADAEAPPGVTVRTTDGHVTVDNSLPGRLARRRDLLAMRILDRLEGDA